MARQPQRPGIEAALVAEPGEGLQSELDEIVAVERDAAADQRLRQARVVVGELVLEPAPVVRGRVAVRVGELLGQALEQAKRLGREPVGVDARQAEDRVGGRPQRHVAGKRAHEALEQVAHRHDDSGDPCRSEDLPERPDGAAHVVADVRLVEPAPVVAHEVAHAVVTGGCVQERERAVEDRCPDLLVAAVRKCERHDGQTGDVVDAVAAVAVRNDPVRVLHDADVVDEGQQVVGAQARQVQIGSAERAAARRERVCLLQHGRRLLRDRRPGERGTDAAGFGSSRRKQLRLVRVRADRGGERCRVVERDERAGARSEHVLRIPVRRRDDPAAGRDRERERARGDLLPVAVRRHEHVGRREQVGKVVDGEEAVVELDVLRQVELEHAPLEHQAVPLSFTACDVRMGATRDDVDDLGVPLDHRRQRFDRGLEALARRDQAEGRELEALVRASVPS